MEMNDFLNMVANIGFPVAVTAYVLIRLEKQMSSLATSFNELNNSIQALINISAKRLCTCADPTTKKYWESVLEAIREYDEDIFWACVPQCIRCGACVEPFSDCRFYENFSKNLTPEQQTDIMARYDAYNEYRGRVLSLKKENKSK